MGEVALILDAFAFVTHPKFAEHRRAEHFLLWPGLKTQFERDVYADFWLRQGNSAKSWLLPSRLRPCHGCDMPLFYDALVIFPPHPRYPPPPNLPHASTSYRDAVIASQYHPTARDMNRLFDITELGWISRKPGRLNLAQGQSVCR
jgi:hypothetical protein